MINYIDYIVDCENSINMVSSPVQIAEKWNREWIQAKPTAITNYVAIASTLAQKAIDAKQTMIDNFIAVMATTRYEDRLQQYVGTDLMGNAYTGALEAITELTPQQILKMETDVVEKRGLAGQEEAVLTLFRNAPTGQVTVPADITSQGLRAMLIQGINNNQYRLSATSTAGQIYTATATYMNVTLGWPIAP